MNRTIGLLLALVLVHPACVGNIHEGLGLEPDELPDSDLENEPEMTVSLPIINGVPSPSAQDGVVLVSLPGGGRCSGSLLTPTLVLTARHCVADTDETLVCGTNGPISGGVVHRDFAASQITIYTGSQRSTLRARARGRELFTTGARNLCSQDIALIRLDRPVTGVPNLAVRTTPPAAGERITSVGWGLTATTTFPTVRQQRAAVTVLEVGPTRRTPNNSFAVGESICSGDSGGPALAANGQIVGVVSFGGGGRGPATNPAAACIGTTARNTYISVAPFAALIARARAASAMP